jgi:hypothetical protein
LNLLLKLFIDICRLRAKPQDVPASTSLMLMALIMVIVTGVPTMVGEVGGLSSAILISLLDVTLTLILLAIFLYMMRLSSRLLQTATAMFGSGAVLNLISLPLVWLMDASPDGSGYLLLGALLFFLLFIWSLVVMGHILQHSFNLQLSSGILLAMGYFLLVYTLVQRFLLTG